MHRSAKIKLYDDESRRREGCNRLTSTQPTIPYRSSRTGKQTQGGITSRKRYLLNSWGRSRGRPTVTKNYQSPLETSARVYNFEIS